VREGVQRQLRPPPAAAAALAFAVPLHTHQCLALQKQWGRQPPEEWLRQSRGRTASLKEQNTFSRCRLDGGLSPILGNSGRRRRVQQTPAAETRAARQRRWTQTQPPDDDEAQVRESHARRVLCSVVLQIPHALTHYSGKRNKELTCSARSSVTRWNPVQHKTERVVPLAAPKSRLLRAIVCSPRPCALQRRRRKWRRRRSLDSGSLEGKCRTTPAAGQRVRRRRTRPSTATRFPRGSRTEEEERSRGESGGVLLSGRPPELCRRHAATRRRRNGAAQDLLSRKCAS
jgi:hypothetical protein